MLRHRFWISILSSLIVVARCGSLAQVRAGEAEGSSDAPAEANKSTESVAARLVDDLIAKKWLTNGQCVACHFKVPTNGFRDLQKLYASDQHGHFTDLSSADFLLLGLSNTRQQQFCVQCHEQASETKGSCTRADRCTRDAEAKHKVTYLGVGVEPVPQAVRGHVKLPSGVGLMIETVEPDSPAARAELRPYDILEKLDGQLLVNQGQFAVLVRMYPPEHAISLELVRANEHKTLTAKLGQREVTGSTPDGLANVDVLVGHGDGTFVEVGAADAAVSKGIEFLQRVQSTADEAASPPGPARVTYLGISTSPPSAALAEQLKLPAERCLMVDSVEADSPAAAAGLKPFDILEKLDDQLIVNSEQLTVLIRLHKHGDEVTLTLIREGKPIQVQIKLGEHGVASNESGQGMEWGDLDANGDADIISFMRGGKRVLLADFDQSNQALADVLAFTVERSELNDQDYMRRVYLDLTGALPSPKDVADFAADQRSDKRKRLVNQLLSRPDVISALGDKAVLQWSDDEHLLTLTTADGGLKRLTAKDHDGKILFEGPVDNDEQRLQLGPRLGAKLSLMLQGLGGPAAAEVPDVEERLERIVPRFSSKGSSLKETIDEIRQATGANIVVDWKSLARSGVTAEEPVEIDLHDVRLRTVLKTLLALAASDKGRLRYTIEDGVILIAAE